MDREAILELLRESLSVSLDRGMADDFSGDTSVTIELRLFDEVISRDYIHLPRE